MYELAGAMLMVSDLAHSIRFYTHMLGFTEGRSLPGQWTEMITTGFSLFLVPRRAGQAQPIQRSAGITLVVHDLEQKKSVLEERGVAFIGETVDAATLRLAIFEDPDANPIFLVEELDDYPTMPIPVAALHIAGAES